MGGGVGLRTAHCRAIQGRRMAVVSKYSAFASSHVCEWQQFIYKKLKGQCAQEHYWGYTKLAHSAFGITAWSESHVLSLSTQLCARLQLILSHRCIPASSQHSPISVWIPFLLLSAQSEMESFRM